MPQIIVENLVKTFRVAHRNEGLRALIKGLLVRQVKTVQALNSVSFKLEEGELVGYIGPNGAGKSTTVKIMSGILVPDSGDCRVLGFTPWRQRREYVGHIGVVFGQRSQLWWDVPVIDSFNLLKEIYRIPRTDYLRTRAELVEHLSLEDLLDTPVRQLSLGQKMRCELAAALLHRPRVLFLDEPTIGLDAVSKLAVRDFIRRINRQHGVTVILTTHDMDDIEALCSRVMIIGRGRLLFDGSISELRGRLFPERILKIDFLGQPAKLDFTGLRLIKTRGRQVEFAFDPRQISSTELVKTVSQCQEIRDFIIENPPIEEIIARTYGDLQI